MTTNRFYRFVRLDAGDTEPQFEYRAALLHEDGHYEMFAAGQTDESGPNPKNRAVADIEAYHHQAGGPVGVLLRRSLGPWELAWDQDADEPAVAAEQPTKTGFPLTVATFFPAAEVEANRVIAAVDNEDGRSSWQWMRLANGDLVLAAYPGGNTYTGLEAAVEADYNDAEMGGNVRRAVLDRADLRDRGITVPHPDDLVALLKDALANALKLTEETSSDIAGSYERIIDTYRRKADEVGLPWSDEYIPAPVRADLGIRIPSDAQKAFDALTDEQKLLLAAQAFETLEYGGPDSAAGNTWSGDTFQALDQVFRQYGVVFTPPEDEDA